MSADPRCGACQTSRSAGGGRRKVGDRRGKQSWIHNTLPKGCRCATGHFVTRGTYIPFPQEYGAIFGYRARAAERRLTKGARVPEAPPQVPQPRRRGHPNPTNETEVVMSSTVETVSETSEIRP